MLDHAMGCPREAEEHASAILAGGLANYGYQCGMIWGACLAAGARACRVFGPGQGAETAAITASQRIIDMFRTCNSAKDTDCLAISGLNMREKFRTSQVLKYLLTGKLFGCFTMAPKVAHRTMMEINAVFTEPPADVPDSPVSCAALVAHNAGLSAEQTVMASGLAGGIGLKGGGCGALAAAVWAYALKHDVSVGLVIDPQIKNVLDRFSEFTGSEFVCSRITGRKFKDVRDHADFLHKGGCSELIAMLASSVDA